MNKQLSGKVAIVTGAGRGVGRAYAHALSAEGALVVVNDLADADGRSPTADVVREIEQAGGQAIANHDSVADFDGVGRMVAQTIDTFGGLDIFVANAGVIRPGLLRTTSPEDWNLTLAVHATGTFNCIRQAAPVMIERGGGSIITTGDITTDLIHPYNGAYRSAKAAIAVTTLTAAEELREFNINVNSVMPGATATRMLDTYFDSFGDDLDSFRAKVNERREKVGKESAPGAPETIPPLGVYLCTSQARHITGKLFQVNWGQIRLVTSATASQSLRAEGDEWTLAELADRVPNLVSEASIAVDVAQ